MPAVVRPELRSQLKKAVKYPTAPDNPPTDKDVAAAIILYHEVFAARQRADATDEELTETFKYQMALINKDQVAEPAWFGAAMTRVLAPIKQDINKLRTDLNAMRADMTTMRTDMTEMRTDITNLRNDFNALTAVVTGIDDRLKTVEQSTSHTRRLAAITWNRSRGSGKEATLEVVVFESGQDPTRPPHSLIPLSTIKVVQSLLPAQRDAYFKGYYPGVVELPLVGERTSLIQRAIGVMV